jgi:hypothetical protein
MAGITTYLLILTLKVSGFNSPIKRHGLVNCIKKEDPTICCLQETNPIDRNKHWLREKGWKEIYQTNGLPKQAGVAILISDKVGFKLTLVKQIIINLYVSNVSVPNFIKHILKDLKAHVDSNTVVVGDFNILLSPIDKKIDKKNQQRNPRPK